SARPREDYLCGKAKVIISSGIIKHYVYRLEKKTGKLWPVRVPPYVTWSLIRDRDESECSVDMSSRVLDPPPSQLLRWKNDDLYYRGEKCVVLPYPQIDELCPQPEIPKTHRGTN